jgi:hypothetical protein
MKKVQLFESFVSEGFEVHYSDGVRAAKKFKSEKDAMSFTKEKIASGKCKEIAIYKDGAGFHSTADTEAVVAWWGDGSYLDNVSKKDSKLAAKKIDESVVTEAKAKGLDWVISELGDKPKCYDVADFVYTNYDKVTGLRKSMRNDEMDFPEEIMDVVDHYGLDIDEFTDCYGMAAESLNVTEGEVNLFDEIGPELEALRSKISGLMKKSTDDKWTSALGKALSAVSTLDRNLSQADSKLGVVLTEGVVSIKGGRIIAHKVLNKLVDMGLIPVKKKSEELLETIAEVITNAKMESVEVNEGAISDIHIMAQEAKDFKSFVKEFTKTHHDLSKAGEPGQFEAWLKSIFNDAKESMDESVVTEGKHWHVLSGNTWYTGSDFSTNPADAMKYDDIMSATKVAKKVGGMVHVMTDEEMTKAIKKFGKNESVVTEAKDVKSEAISRLSDFFRVSPNALSHLKFDGKDSIKDVTKALNATSYEGAEAYYKIAIEMAKKDLGVDEAIKPAGLSKAETKKVAETYAKAISKHDGCKCTVNAKSLEEDSFDLDIDGEEYAGGSYMITLDGDVINAALPEKPVYGQIDSTVDQIIKNLKK